MRECCLAGGYNGMGKTVVHCNLPSEVLWVQKFTEDAVVSCPHVFTLFNVTNQHIIRDLPPSKIDVGIKTGMIHLSARWQNVRLFYTSRLPI